MLKQFLLTLKTLLLTFNFAFATGPIIKNDFRAQIEKNRICFLSCFHAKISYIFLLYPFV